MTVFKQGDRVVSPGTPPLYGVVERVSDNGWELEITQLDVETGERTADFWPASETRLNIECTTCGELATHLYATFEPSTGHLHSMHGLNLWSPSCDNCDEPELVEPMEGVFRITGPLEMWRECPQVKGTTSPPF